MNSRPISAELQTRVVGETHKQLDKAESKDVFYTCMAMSRGLGKKLFPQNLHKLSDLFYVLYLMSSKNIKEFDMYQLG